MTAKEHLNINLFPAIILVAIYLDNKRKMQQQKDSSLFGILLLLLIGVLLTDTLDWIVNGYLMQALAWCVNIAHMILAMTVPCVWLVYVRFRFYGNQKMRMYEGMLFSLLFLFSLSVLTMPWTHLYFTITADGRYERGAYYFVPYLLYITLLMAGILLVYMARLLEASKDRRKEFGYMMAVPFIPIAGVSVQCLWEDWQLGVPSAVIALLSLYFHTQNRQITTDGLTGLNNRREFDQHIWKKAEQGDKEWGLMILDIDEFKMINDKLGHAIGDDALRETADILRRTVQEEPAFLARYGGDEFTVIGDWGNTADAEKFIRCLNREVSRQNLEGKSPYKLSFSVGYALWDENKDDSIQDFIAKADGRMYMQKLEKKRKGALDIIR